MNTLEQVLSSDFVYRFGWMLLHSLWLMLLPAFVLMFSLLAVPRRMSQLRYLMSVVTLVVMLAQTRCTSTKGHPV